LSYSLNGTVVHNLPEPDQDKPELESQTEVTVDPVDPLTLPDLPGKSEPTPVV